VSDPIEVLRCGCYPVVTEIETALAQIEELVEAARRAEQKLHAEYQRGLACCHQDESWAEGEALAAALTPFK
jgi:hypothetical protein